MYVYVDGAPSVQLLVPKETKAQTSNSFFADLKYKPPPESPLQDEDAKLGGKVEKTTLYFALMNKFELS